jgi:hypothetical protein
MHNCDLEKFYRNIDGSIKLIAAWIENNTLEKIIKSCRLKPYSVFTKKIKTETRLEKYWVDEYGNSLVISNENINVILNDLAIEKDIKISTDLFYGCSIEYFIDNGKIFLIIDNIISILGEDQYLRSFIFDERWISVSPLILGIDILHNLFDHKLKTISLPRCRDEAMKQINALQQRRN